MRSEPIGQQFGDYRVLRMLKQGGQACVYLGQHVRLQQRLAAIKLLQTWLSNDDIEDFQREAETISQLQHPHIVNILDFNVKEGIPFIIMDYYPSGTLRERHPSGQQVPLETVVGYVRQVAEALQFAHDHHVIHRDVKAANMLIGSHDTIVLSDFGIAATAHNTSSMFAQTLAGTIHYMAPEQIKQFPRRESDQYALAIVTYEWLTGKLPFTGFLEEIAVKHLLTEPPSLLEHLPHLPVHIEQVIFKALAKAPKERFSCVLDFALVLEDAIHAERHSSSFFSALEASLKFAEPGGQSLAQEPPNSPEQASGKLPTDPETSLLGVPFALSVTEPVEEERKEETSSEEQEPVVSSNSLESAASVSKGEISTQARPETPPPSPLIREPAETEPLSVSTRPLILRPPERVLASALARPIHTEDRATDTWRDSSTTWSRLVEGRQQPLNGKVIMRKIGREDTPATWRILLPSPARLALFSLLRGLHIALLSVLNISILFWILTVLSSSDFVPSSSSFPIGQIWASLQLWSQESTIAFFSLFLLGPALIALILGCIAALRYRFTQGQHVLVLLPEGLVYGKRHQHKRLQVINYWEVVSLRAVGKYLVFQLLKKNGGIRQVRLDFSLFPSPRTLVLTIKSSHDRYKQARG